MTELKKFSISLIIFSIVFSSILYFKTSFEIAVVVFSFVFILGLVSFFNENFCSCLKNNLEKFGKFLGQKLATITLFIIWVFAIVPTKILMTLVKRDRLHLKKENQKSYWQDATKDKNDYELQY